MTFLQAEDIAQMPALLNDTSALFDIKLPNVDDITIPTTHLAHSEARIIAVIILSFPLGRALRSIPKCDPVYRHLFNIWVSLAFLNYVFQDFRVLIYFFTSAVSTFFIARYGRGKFMPWIGMTLSMAILAITRMDRFANNIPYIFLNPNVTQPQMMLTMKLVSFCWNVHDGSLSPHQLTRFQKDQAIQKMPGLLEFTSYVLFFPTLFSEPFIDFAQFRQYMSGTMPTTGKPEICHSDVESSKTPISSSQSNYLSGSTSAAWWKALQGFVLLYLYEALSKRYNIDFLLSPSIATTTNLHLRVLLVHVILLTTRVRAYGIWALSEGISIACGLGCKSFDPMTGQPIWDGVRNADFFGVEFSDCPKQYLKSWNLTVCHWLRHYVHERISAPGLESGFRKRTATLAFSALWHGFEPGFYISFVAVSLVQSVANDVHKLLRWPRLAMKARGSPSSFQKIASTAWKFLRLLSTLLSWMVIQTLLDFAIVPFAAGSLTGVFKVWSNLSWYGITLMTATLVCTRGFSILGSMSAAAKTIISRTSGFKTSLGRMKLAQKNLVVMTKSRKNWTAPPVLRLI